MKKVLSIVVLLLSFGFSFTFAQNSAGNALYLDGVDDFASPTSTNVSGNGVGTIEMWFAVDVWTATSSLWVGGNGLPGVNGDWIRLGTHTSTGSGPLSFGFFVGSNWRWAQTGIIPGLNQWTHIAATWDAAGLKIYINGVLSGTNGYNGVAPTHPTELLGVSAWGGYLEGQIDEVRLWNVARDSAQINSTMLDTLSSEYFSTSDSGLIAYYRMEMLEDLGVNSDGVDDLRDLSINGNHLDTYGDPNLDVSGAFIITGVEKTNNEIPEHYSLKQNYPNPFNPSTKISFKIVEAGFTSLKVYDVLGNEVVTLVNEELQNGSYEIEFDAFGLTSGIYFYKLQSGSFIETKKMLLLK